MIQPLKRWLTCAAFTSFLAVRAASCSAWCKIERTGEVQQVKAGGRATRRRKRVRARKANVPHCTCHQHLPSPSVKQRTAALHGECGLPSCLRSGALSKPSSCIFTHLPTCFCSRASRRGRRSAARASGCCLSRPSRLSSLRCSLRSASSYKAEQEGKGRRLGGAGGMGTAEHLLRGRRVARLVDGQSLRSTLSCGAGEEEG